MRLILTLVTIVLFSYKVTAKVDRPRIGKIDTVLAEMSALSTNSIYRSSAAEIKTAILYKMKENMIRRELSFTPKKRWIKWA